MTFDSLLEKQYQRDSYNCAHFVCDVWKTVTGNAITDTMKGFLLSSQLRNAPLSIKNKFTVHKKPISPCIVLFRRRGEEPHVGVYFKRRVMHLTEDGARYQLMEVASLGYTSVRYYTC